MSLPRRGEIIEVSGVGLCYVRRILPNGVVEVEVSRSHEVLHVELVTAYRVKL
jgi:hypothetical protein